MDGPSSGSFDSYIAELHEFLDRLRETPDVDERCSTLVADLAEAYSEQPSPMQTGRREFLVQYSSLIEIFKQCVSRLYFVDKRIF